MILGIMLLLNSVVSTPPSYLICLGSSLDWEINCPLIMFMGFFVLLRKMVQ
jgi:hypothetical protein